MFLCCSYSAKQPFVLQISTLVQVLQEGTLGHFISQFQGHYTGADSFTLMNDQMTLC